ncbi:MAG: ATP-dependent 6-phosphofructokinase [Pirellulales bacterium]|nr:ATP-dependent 6-phosphofructokinase [Pirellulales bacterium]
MNHVPDFSIASLGRCKHPSPIVAGGTDTARACYFVGDDERILFDDHVTAATTPEAIAERPTIELAGPREAIYFDPAHTRIGIVTCGGLCPGLNNVVRGLVTVAHYRYGVRECLGFRYGYQGLTRAHRGEALRLTVHDVSEIHLRGGTLLSSSRGPQEPAEMVDCLVDLGVNVLFTIGGDGTLRGALAIAAEVARRGLPIAVVGVPKTIDNDIMYLDQSFGFGTAYEQAVDVIVGAHNEATGAPNGVGLVKLMGRHSGFIACLATLATSHVNFTLIPEVPLQLDGPRGFLHSLGTRLERRGHAVVVVAEGAGQNIWSDSPARHDASGNVKLHDVGPFLADAIRDHFKQLGREVNLKYLDPSYMIRSQPANATDGVYCWRLAQNAVHAAMAGKTAMVVGQWHERYVHLPMQAVIAARRRVEPEGDLWLSVLESTGQPHSWT